MAYDELLRLTGSTNNALETITASGNGSAVYVGADRLVQAELRVAGAVTGTTPTLDLKLQSSADGSTSWADIPGGAFPQRTTSDISGGGAVPGSGPNRIAFLVPSGRPYVRLVKTIGGTATPTFTSTSVLLTAPAGGVAAG